MTELFRLRVAEQAPEQLLAPLTAFLASRRVGARAVSGAACPKAA
jgi:hypothetical protein